MGYVSRPGQCTRSAAAVVAVAAEHDDEQRPEHDDDVDDDNAVEVVAVVDAEAGRTSADAAAVAVGNERPIVAGQTSRKSREGRDRRLGSAAYYYSEL